MCIRDRLTSNNRANEEIEHQLMKARRIAGCMNNLIWNNKYLKQDGKTRVYNSTIHPVSNNSKNAAIAMNWWGESLSLSTYFVGGHCGVPIA